MKKGRLVFWVLFAAVLLWTLWGNTALQLTPVTVSSSQLPEAFDGFRVAHVSDLHNAEFGQGNEELLSLLREAAPDIIAITGDLVDSRRTDIEIALAFAKEAVKIAPCYYVTGNHEARISGYRELKNGLQDLGVTVLENRRVDLEKGGQRLAILGIDDPNFAHDGRYGDNGEVTAVRISDLWQEGEGYGILLSHRPELFETYVESGVDLVLSGHAHGGQFRLPFIGGLYAPGQGFFPGYDSGAYSVDGTTMLVSRGLGNSAFPLRFNNRPEIILVTLERT